MSFRKEVQNSLVHQPSQFRFTKESWTEHYERTKKTPGDDHLYHAGLFYFEKFEKIRIHLKDISELDLSKDKLIRIYVGLANRDMKVASALVSEALTKKSKEKPLSMSQLIEASVPTPLPGHEVHAVKAIEGFVSALRFPLSDIIQRYNKLRLSKPTDKENAKELLGNAIKKVNLAVLYHSYGIFWLDTLWNNWTLIEEKDRDITEAPNSSEQRAATIGEHRIQTLLNEFTHHSLKLWKRLTPGQRRMAAEPRSFIKIVNKAGKKETIIGNVDLDYPSPGWINILAFQDAYMEKLSSETLPIFNGATIKEFLRIYEHLHHLANAITDYIPNDLTTGSPPQVLEFAPVFETELLIRDLISITKIERKKVESVIQTLTFTGDVKEDLWLHPLVPISPDKLTPILPALRNPNLARSVEYWLGLAKVKLEDRGEEFERYIRQRIGDQKETSQILKVSKVINRSFTLTIDTDFEEIDFIWFIGNKIILGEAKCISHPAEPIEWKNLFDIVEFAKEQILRKKSFVQNNLEEFLKLTDYEMKDLGEIELIPIIILSRPMMSGITIDGVPITDMFILERFCDEQYERILSKGKNEQSTVIRFFNTWIEAQNTIKPYLESPPIIEEYKQLLALDETTYPPLFGNDRTFIQKGFKIIPESNVPEETDTPAPTT